MEIIARRYDPATTIFSLVPGFGCSSIAWSFMIAKPFELQIPNEQWS